MKSISHLKNLLIDLTSLPLLRPVPCKQICANLNHCKVIKAELSQLIPSMLIINKQAFSCYLK